MPPATCTDEKSETWTIADDEDQPRRLQRVERGHPAARRDEDGHGVERGEVGEGLDLDHLEVVDVVLVDARDAADQDALRIDVRQRAELRPGGDDEVAGRDDVLLEHAPEHELVAARAVLDESVRVRPQVGRGDRTRRVGEQRHLRDPRRDPRDPADEAVAGDDGIVLADALVLAGGDRDLLLHVRRRARDHARVDRAEVLREARALLVVEELLERHVLIQRRLRRGVALANVAQVALELVVLGARA